MTYKKKFQILLASTGLIVPWTSPSALANGKIIFLCHNGPIHSADDCFDQGKKIIEVANCTVSNNSSADVSCKYDPKPVMPVQQRAFPLSAKLSHDTSWKCEVESLNCQDGAVNGQGCPKGWTPSGKTYDPNTQIAFMANPCVPENSRPNTAPKPLSCQAVVTKLLKREGISSGLPIHGDDMVKVINQKPFRSIESPYPDELQLNELNGNRLFKFGLSDSGEISTLRITQDPVTQNFTFRREGENCGIDHAEIYDKSRSSSDMQLNEKQCSKSGEQNDTCKVLSGLFFTKSGPASQVPSPPHSGSANAGSPDGGSPRGLSSGAATDLEAK